MSTKKVKTQNSKPKASDDYKGLIQKVYHLDEHIATLTKSRDDLIFLIMAEFNKSSENIKFELGKLKGN